VRLRAKHYWRRRLREKRREALGRTVCDPVETIARLSGKPQETLTWFDRWIALLTTPFKFCGISGWTETGCEARAAGRPVRDAQHSTDGFWTIDVRLERFAVGAEPAGLAEPRFVRVEVEPGTKAHDVCAATRVLAGMGMAFAGAVVVDTDGPFLEVHPEEEFRIVGEGSGRP
jgi:hypothetical protein